MQLAVLLVLAAASHALLYEFPDCANGPLAGTPVCDTSLDYYARASALVDMFTLNDFLRTGKDASNSHTGGDQDSLLTNTASPPVSRLGLSSYQWWSEALHGVADSPGVTFNKGSGNFSSATSFPQPINLGASFDDDIIYDIASVISTEGRAFNNFRNAGLDYWTPNINPYKDPRWGRGQETPGEDPLRLSRYVFNLINGFQGVPEQSYFGLPVDYVKTGLKVVPTCKHVAGYDLEGWEGVSRHQFNAMISDQDLVEFYLPSFRTCVRDARVGSIMCSYNALNGAPSCANKYLLQDIVRDHWGFSDYHGYVTSDCGAVADVYSGHNFSSSPEQAAADALIAGTDTNCGSYYADYLASAYNMSLITENDLKQAVTRQYAALVRMGYFDPPDPQPFRQLNWSDVNTPAAQALALRASQESITLLKNDGVLPLCSKSIALIGPWANATTQMQGNYYGTAPYLISPLAAAKSAGLNVDYVYGCNTTGSDTSGFDAAMNAARNADVVIFAGGLDELNEAEGMDRYNLTWPGPQLDLIQQLETVGKPLVVLQMGGGQVDDTYLKYSPKVNAIVWGGYPGQSGGQAIVDALTGAYPPAGRLPVTQYPADYINQISFFDMNLRPATNSPGRTYKWYNGDAVFPFGYGLHYTTFDYQWGKGQGSSFDISNLVSMAQGSWSSAPDKTPLTTMTVQVTNTGMMASDNVVLLFSNSTAGPSPAPMRELISYDRVYKLAPGASSMATLNLTAGNIARADDNGNLWLYPGSYNVFVDVDAKISGTITLTGSATMLDMWPQNNATSMEAPVVSKNPSLVPTTTSASTMMTMTTKSGSNVQASVIQSRYQTMGFPKEPVAAIYTSTVDAGAIQSAMPSCPASMSMSMGMSGMSGAATVQAASPAPARSSPAICNCPEMPAATPATNAAVASAAVTRAAVNQISDGQVQNPGPTGN